MSAPGASIRLSVDSGRKATGADRAELSVSLVEFRALNKLCRAVYDIDSNLDTFWFSWNIFGKVFQSNRFSYGDNGLRAPETDKMLIEGSEATVVDRLHELSSMGIYLCTTGNVIAQVVIPVDRIKGLGGEDEPAVDAWFNFELLGDFNNTIADFSPAIRVLLTITRIDKDLQEDFNGGGAVDEYGDEEFESVDGGQGRSIDDDEHDAEIRHFRFSFQVRSIGGLKHAANACIHFSYPHLGVNGSTVRTRPSWCISHSENMVHGAAATYDCCMVPNDLKAALLQNPIQVVVDTRNNLGFNYFGRSIVPIESLLRCKPYSYRCPVTGKTFKDISSYRSHRNAMSVAASRVDFDKNVPTGTIGRVPPHDPVTVRTLDAYYALRGDKAADSSSSTGAMLGKLRIIMVLEDLGKVEDDALWPVRSGYKMQNGAIYEVPQNEPDLGGLARPASVKHFQPGDDTSADLDPLFQQQLILQQRYREWEDWQRETEDKWRESLREKESQLKASITAEASAKLAQQADDLKRAQEEAARLEVRLRNSIEAAERQKSQLELKEEQMKIRLAQKTAELQLLQRRVRDEARSKIDAEIRRAENAEKMALASEEAKDRAEKRALAAERDFDLYRQHVKSLPETTLREELSKLRAQLAESKESIERERRVRAEVELEREHFKAQMHRLALALKREREKSSIMARQELEQLRLEFLAREERYILDGDREELRHIRNELSNLRLANQVRANVVPLKQTKGGDVTNTKRQAGQMRGVESYENLHSTSDPATSENADMLSRLMKEKKELLSTGLYSVDDELILEIDQAILEMKANMAERSE